MARRGFARYRKIGVPSMEIATLDLTPLPEGRHAMAAVTWDSRTRRGSDDRRVRIRFDHTEFLALVGGKARSFAYIATDERAILKRHGLISRLAVQRARSHRGWRTIRAPLHLFAGSQPMKGLRALFLVCCVVLAAPAVAAPPQSAPLAGRWALDVAQMPLPPEARPRRVTITFNDAAEGRWAMDVEIVDAGGTVNRMASTAALDGTPIRLEDNIEADSAAMRMPAPNVLVVGLGRAGVPASTRTYTVAADGASMVEIASYVGPDGMPLLRTNHFTRAR